MKTTTQRVQGILICMVVTLSGAQLSGQIEMRKSDTKSSDMQLSKHFLDAEIFHLDMHEVETLHQDIHLSMELPGQEVVQISLTPVDLLGPEYVALDSRGREISIEDVQPYIGNIPGDPSSDIRLTISKGTLYGYVSTQYGKYYVEPTQRFLHQKRASKGEHIIYHSSQVKDESTFSCAAHQHSRQAQKIQNQHDKSPKLKSVTCKSVDLAIAMDNSYRVDHGGASGAISQSISVMNMVAGVYEDGFSTGVRFKIVEHFVSDCSSCDPWTTSTNANTLLTDFTNKGTEVFQKSHDLGQLWTNRDLCTENGCGVAGLAWINTVCGTFRYHILEDYTTSAWQLRVLASHELGHNFGANHDASDSPHIMAPSVGQNTTTWSAQSISDVDVAMQDFLCMDDCLIGTCSEIASIRTSNCMQGTPSTYTLTIVMEHGGGSEAGFGVLVNGQTYQQTYSTSPQTITISDLVADGTEDNRVEIRANDGSDGSCFAVDTYDEPSGNCTMIVAVDFNDKSLPHGWTSTSTNNITWNGGDPRVQYEWKFADEDRQFGNYDNGSNSSANKTIDGTAMAVMDDDLFSHVEYTGKVTLQSPIYDMSEFGELSVQLDYNFHPFETGGSGKGPNDSYFSIEVYDGSQWVEVHRAEDSACPWYDVWPVSCQTHPDIDLSEYINAQFSARFVYSDGETGDWAGMVALDNVVLIASGTLVELPSACDDGVQNGDETGVDCGGSACTACPTCDDGVQNGDETGVDCGGSACTACPTCDDGVQNGDETGVDCGGSACTACPTCDDGMQNGDETGVDCGGSACTVCPTCDDGVQNGDETGVDCGGAACAPCVVPTCDDHIMNGDETGIDCGGSMCAPCDCPDEVTIGEDTEIQSVHQAQQMVRTVGAVIVNTAVIFSASNIEINEGFEIQIGTPLEAYKEGCHQ